MGQKVNPNGFRVGVNKDWNSTWIAPKKEIAENNRMGDIEFTLRNRKTAAWILENAKDA